MKVYFLTSQLFIITTFLLFSQHVSLAQTGKSVNSRSSVDDPNDIVFVFHQVNDDSFPTLPSPDNQEEIRLFYKNLSFWMSKNAEGLNQQIFSNQLKKFALQRSAIRHLESSKQSEFKKFYNQLDGYIQFVVNQRTIPQGYIILPPSVFEQLISFFN